MKNKTILLVDDEKSILSSFRKDFEYEGYTTVTAESGEEAIERLKSNYFNLLITDLVMPGIDGIAVMNEAKNLNPDMGAMILTGYGDLSSAIEALRLGADDYLFKPCDSEELLLRAKRFFEKQEALIKIKIYEDILPICMYCKSIRDDSGAEHGKGKWIKIEKYLTKKSGIDLSHCCCPKCRPKMVKDMGLD